MTRIALLRPIDPPVLIDGSVVDGRGLAVASKLDLIEAIQVWRTAQEAVDGYIEVLPLTESIFNPDPRPFSQGWHLSAYINEEGRLRGLPISCAINHTPIFGPIVIVRERVDGEGETHYADLTEEDIETARGMLQMRLVVVPAKESAS